MRSVFEDFDPRENVGDDLGRIFGLPSPPSSAVATAKAEATALSTMARTEAVAARLRVELARLQDELMHVEPGDGANETKAQLRAAKEMIFARLRNHST